MILDPHRQFTDLFDAWAVALVANDPDAIDQFVEPEWVLVGETGIFPREQFLASVASGKLTHDSFHFEVNTVRIYGGVAVVIVRVTNTGAYEGVPFELDEWTTDVFVRRGDSWKCVHSHLTAASDSTAAAELQEGAST